MTGSLDPRSPSTMELAGQAANRAAAQHAFDDYRSRKSLNTLRAHDVDLSLFGQYLHRMGLAVEYDLATDPAAWNGMTWGLVQSFVIHLLNQGYAVGSINRVLSTVKRYAELAFKSGTVDAQSLALIRTVKGYQHREKKEVDAKRPLARKGAKKASAVAIPDEVAEALKIEQPETPQGRRDALLMCLLLDHGLRCGELAALTVGSVNLSQDTLTFYRQKVDKVQTHRLTPDTRRALSAWIHFGDCPLTADAKLLRASNKAGDLGAPGMSERAITKRVQVLGVWKGIPGLSAHDCRHYWATRASRKGTDPFALQEAGGWNSLAMPRRYVEAARIANEGVKLE